MIYVNIHLDKQVLGLNNIQPYLLLGSIGLFTDGDWLGSVSMDNLDMLVACEYIKAAVQAHSHFAYNVLLYATVW